MMNYFSWKIDSRIRKTPLVFGCASLGVLIFIVVESLKQSDTPANEPEGILTYLERDLEMQAIGSEPATYSFFPHVGKNYCTFITSFTSACLIKRA